MTTAGGRPAFDAFVFDLDGTLIETEELWDQVRRGLAAEEGRPWPEAATTAMMGMSTPEWSTYLVDEVGLSGTPAEAAERTIAGMLEHYHRGLPILPGAREAIRRLSVLPLGVTTSSPRVLLDAALAELGVTELFAATVSTEEVDRGKPAPDGYLETCRRLGVDPRRCVAAEDSANGIRSVKAAGMAGIAVLPKFRPPGPEVLALADAVVESLDQLTVDLLEGIATRTPGDEPFGGPR